MVSLAIPSAHSPIAPSRRPLSAPDRGAVGTREPEMGCPVDPLGLASAERARTFHKESDEILMVRVAHADRAACGQLVERHLGRILALASRTLGDRTAAEDVAQEVFFRLWIHAKRWQPGA